MSRCTKTYPCAQCVLGRLINKYDILISPKMHRLFWATFGQRINQVANTWVTLHRATGLDPAPAFGFMGHYPAMFDFLDFVGRRRFEFVRAWRTICLQVGAWWFEGDAVVIAQRPVKVERNQQGQVSCNRGPAVVYGDGGRLYAWRGALVREALIVALRGDVIHDVLGGVWNMRDASRLIEMYGFERFLKEVPLRWKAIIDKSKWGTLWRVQSDSRDVRLFVEVRNTTGRQEIYVIPIDPWLRPLGPTGPLDQRVAMPQTALQAIASTFGMSAEQYADIVET